MPPICSLGIIMANLHPPGNKTLLFFDAGGRMLASQLVKRDTNT
jgi:hypothetical protein